MFSVHISDLLNNENVCAVDAHESKHVPITVWWRSDGKSVHVRFSLRFYFGVDSFEIRKTKFLKSSANLRDFFAKYFCSVWPLYGYTRKLWNGHRFAVEHFEQPFKFWLVVSSVRARFDHLFRSQQISNEVEFAVRSIPSSPSMSSAIFALIGSAGLFIGRQWHANEHSHTHTAIPHTGRQ